MRIIIIETAPCPHCMGGSRLQEYIVHYPNENIMDVVEIGLWLILL
jgi:hypothetical protein